MMMPSNIGCQSFEKLSPFGARLPIITENRHEMRQSSSLASHMVSKSLGCERFRGMSKFLFGVSFLITSNAFSNRKPKEPSTEFAPDPVLDPLWLSYKELFHGAIKKDRDLQLVPKVAEKTEVRKTEVPRATHLRESEKLPELKSVEL